MTRKLITETPRAELAALLDQVLIDVPLHSVKTAIVLAVKKYIAEGA